MTLLSRVRPALQHTLRQARRFGLPGAAGLLMLGSAGFVALGVLPRGEAALAADEAGVRAARQRAQAAMRAAQVPARQDDPVQAYLQSFPEAAGRHRRVERLMQLAAAQGLAARRSELRTQASAVSGLQRLRVTMPVTGGYAQVRRFVEQALRDDPALGLDQLRLERADATQRPLRAELQWSLWMRAEGPVTAPPAGVRS
jgi:hypothetical protein